MAENRDDLTRFGDMSGDAIAMRLTAARKAAGYQQKEFAREMHLSTSTYNSQEKRGAPSKAVLARLYKLHGIDFNFIYFGDMRFLPAPLQRELLAAIEEVRAASTLSSEPIDSSD